MYATSKLIIPPKPARNIPYIPKLRIKLRPSNSRGRLLHLKRIALEEQPVKELHSQSTSVPRQNIKCYMNGANQDRIDGFVGDVDPIGSKNESSYDQCSLTSSPSLGKRTNNKRKRSIPPEDFDLDNPESLLTKINLRAIINRDTFYALPIDTQRNLASLLPIYDRDKHLWDTFSSALAQLGPSDGTDKSASAEAQPSTEPSSESVWLHESALSNEFLTKAVQDYADSQRQGGLLAQRARNRAGLRTSVAGRVRYTNLTQSEDDSENNSNTSASCNGTGKFYHTRRSNRHHLPLNHHNHHPHHYHHQHKSCDQLRARRRATATASSSSASTEVTKPARKFKLTGWRGRPKSNRLSKMAGQSATTAHSRNTRCASRSVLKSKLAAQLTETEPVVQLSPDQKLPEKIGKSSPKLHTSPEDSSTPPVLGATSHQFPDCSELTGSPATSKHALPTDYGKHQPVSPFGSPVHQTRGNRSSSGSSTINDSPSPAGMPPPRQTKTLAAMREKLRAKRLMKEAERSGSGKSFYGLPGSMTPHPASGSSGYFHQPSNYPPVTPIFGAPSMSEDIKPSVRSALSSPRMSETSPVLCDKTSDLSSIPSDKHTSVKLDADSPSPPRCLGSTDLLSPSSNHSANAQLFSQPNGQTPSRILPIGRNSASYPSSPSIKSLIPPNDETISSFRDLPQLPCSTSRMDSSSSAPSTPNIPQFEQISMGHTTAAPFADSCVSNDNKQNPLIYITPAQPSNKPIPAATTVTVASGTIFPSTASNNQMIGSQLRTSYSFPHLPTSSCNPEVNHSSVPRSGSVATSPQKPLEQTSNTTSASGVSSSSVSQLLGAANSRPSSTTRAFLVDGDNLSQALAWVQSSNPEATITQLQCFVIPGANKSQMFLYRVPSTDSSAAAAATSTTTSTVLTSLAPTSSGVSLSKGAKSSTQSSLSNSSVASISAHSKPVQSLKMCSSAATAVGKSDTIAIPINIQPGIVIPDPKPTPPQLNTFIPVSTKTPIPSSTHAPSKPTNLTRAPILSHSNPYVVDLTQEPYLSNASVACHLNRCLPTDPVTTQSQLTISLLSPPPSTVFISEPQMVMISNPMCQSVKFSQRPIDASPYQPSFNTTTTTMANHQQFSSQSTPHSQQSTAQFTVINSNLCTPLTAAPLPPPNFNSHIPSGFCSNTSITPLCSNSLATGLGGRLHVGPPLSSQQYHPATCPSPMDAVYMQTANLISTGAPPTLFVPQTSGNPAPNYTSTQWIIHPDSNTNQSCGANRCSRSS